MIRNEPVNLLVRYFYQTKGQKSKRPWPDEDEDVPKFRRTNAAASAPAARGARRDAQAMQVDEGHDDAQPAMDTDNQS